MLEHPCAAFLSLAFPDIYEIGMSHLGTNILSSVLNETDEIACERVFSSWLECEGELRSILGAPPFTAAAVP